MCNCTINLLNLNTIDNLMQSEIAKNWVFLWVCSNLISFGVGLGSMSSIAISYGPNGPIFCGLKQDGSHFAYCFGGNSAIIKAMPPHHGFIGLTGGDGFICGLLIDSKQPYCWGNNAFVKMGIPQNTLNGFEYVEISAGDNHFCGLQKPLTGKRRNFSIVDCWGYNMTAQHVFDGQIQSITAGSDFNCGLFSRNKTIFCWGDELNSDQMKRIPRDLRFQRISAGGFHVCGILEGVSSRVSCWGRSIDLEEEIPIVIGFNKKISVEVAPTDPMLSVVGGKFHACAIKSYDHGVVCWGYTIEKSTPPPSSTRLYEIAAGDYFSCGILTEGKPLPACWGSGFPPAPPLAVSPCSRDPCGPGSYNNGTGFCKLPKPYLCLPCSKTCPAEMLERERCGPSSDRVCEFNCSSCFSNACFKNCSFPKTDSENKKFWPVHLSVFVAEIAFAVLLVIVVALASIFYVRFKLRKCKCSGTKTTTNTASKNNGKRKVEPALDDIKIRRARMFTYEELERATDGFKDELQVGKGSFSCVFKGVLKHGTIVAVKRAIVSTDTKKNSKEFHTELDLLSRLNHAHLLNLLGYCEEGRERLLVYEFMANGSLHEHLHGKNKALKEQLDWVRRVTIAVQAARGIEYLHGYACPPVIHRDIKSSNILIDEEHNARVADFGLSLLGPANSSSPLAELPAGTLGYLDPEYYRLHYLTTKSDVYSFGVLILEILSGRKAIDMQFEEGNIVEWAVPLIKSGEIEAVLDPILQKPSDLEALKRIANVACKCVRMRGKERPSMDKVTTALERGLALLMGSPSNDQPILPTEVVLGSSRMNKKSSQLSSNRSASEADVVEADDPREFRAPSWITFPSVTSSQRRKSSVSETDVDPKISENRNFGSGGDGLRSLDEEIGPASPREKLFLQHNF